MLGAGGGDPAFNGGKFEFWIVVVNTIINEGERSLYRGCVAFTAARKISAGNLNLQDGPLRTRDTLRLSIKSASAAAV